MPLPYSGPVLTAGWADQAVAAGAILVNETVVEDLLWDKGRVVGVRAGRPQGEVEAQVVIIAEGVNSMLTQKAGLAQPLKPQQVALSVKEIISLPREKIEDRFALEENQGCTIELIGDAVKGMMGTAFIYTNKDSLSVGVGVLLSHLLANKINPNDLLERLKAHPLVKKLIEGGTTREYMAHMIPEGGYRSVPRLYGDGVLVVGDAAMLVNGLHREGINLAFASGMMAAQAVLNARQKGDYSASSLSLYKKLLEDSFVLKDLKKYKDAPEFLARNTHFFTLYPQLASQAAREFLTVDGVPKREKQRKIWQEIKAKRGLWGLIKDAIGLWRVMK